MHTDRAWAMLSTVHDLAGLVATAELHHLLLAASYAVVVVAVGGEGIWLATTEGLGRLRRFPAAAAMGLGGLAVGGLVTATWSVLWPVVGAASPAWLADRWAAHPTSAALAAFVAWDAAGYAYHRLGHSTRLGWASHQAHHTGTAYDLSLAWRQTWFPLHALVVFPLVAVLGIDLVTLAGCAAVSNAWQALLHTERPIPVPGWIAAVVMTPATHRRHHTLAGGATNLGPVLTVWDRLAGTWDPEPVGPTERYGIAGRDDVGGAIHLELAGWRRMFERAPTGQTTPQTSSARRASARAVVTTSASGTDSRGPWARAASPGP